MQERKIFILDTSVLLYDKESIHSFPDNDVVLPLIVLDEIDNFKDRKGLLGESARYINRYLDTLRKNGKIYKGILIKNGSKISVDIGNDSAIPLSLNSKSNDNKIISVALRLKSDNPTKRVIVVTKDINLRVKCDSLSLEAEDYNKDKIEKSEKGFYNGSIEIDTDTEIINKFYNNNSIDIEDLNIDNENIYPNQFITAISNNNSFIGINKKNTILPIHEPEKGKVKPRNKEQKFANHALKDDSIHLVSITGIAGTGKTYLTLCAAIEGMLEKKYKKIIVTRSLEPVGKEIGFLPGDIGDKVDPWMGSIEDNFRSAYGDVMFFQSMKARGDLEVIPLAFVRGRTFNDTFIIVDEAQNSSIHELKTIITRIGTNSKIVLLGDIDQIDTPYLDSTSNGLTIISEKFKESELAAHISLVKGVRSELATLATKIL